MMMDHITWAILKIITAMVTVKKLINLELSKKVFGKMTNSMKNDNGKIKNLELKNILIINEEIFKIFIINTKLNCKILKKSSN
jgi:hypothetical protein